MVTTAAATPQERTEVLRTSRKDTNLMHTNTTAEAIIAATINDMRVPKTAPITRRCDCCGEAQAVLDAPTVHGPWAYMCLACVSTHGVAGYARIGTRLLGIPTAQIPWTPPLPTDDISDDHT